jgi:hypothetical protein
MDCQLEAPLLSVAGGLVHLPHLRPRTKPKWTLSAVSGLAACPSLGLLALSIGHGNDILVMRLPTSTHPRAPDHTPAFEPLGFIGESSSPPIRFGFMTRDSIVSGCLAFTYANAAAGPLLVATDASQGAVHLVDVCAKRHVGYVVPPRGIRAPFGVAARGNAVAVSISEDARGVAGPGARLYCFEDGAWHPVRLATTAFTVPPGLRPRRPPWAVSRPGLRFGADGTTVVIAQGDCLSLFRAVDGAFLRLLATDLPGSGAEDVEEVQGGWLVACYIAHRVVLVKDNERGGCSVDPPLSLCDWPADAPPVVGTRVEWDVGFPAALTTVPGLGLLLLGSAGLDVYVTQDMLAMGTMSLARVAWMVAVAQAMRCVVRPRGP